METDDFSVSVQGNIRSVEFPEQTNICVKLSTMSSGDWKVANSGNAVLSSFSYRGTDNNIFIDLPFEFSMQGTSSFLWPRVVLSCYSQDSSGRDVIVGYGLLSIPTVPGMHTNRVYCFLPESSSIIQQVIAKFRRVNAEFVDPLFAATTDERQACRTSTKGYVDVELNVCIKTAEVGLKFTSSYEKPRTNYSVPASVLELAGVKMNEQEEKRNLDS